MLPVRSALSLAAIPVGTGAVSQGRGMRVSVLGFCPASHRPPTKASCPWELTETRSAGLAHCSSGQAVALRRSSRPLHSPFPVAQASSGHRLGFGAGVADPGSRGLLSCHNRSLAPISWSEPVRSPGAMGVCRTVGTVGHLWGLAPTLQHARLYRHCPRGGTELQRRAAVALRSRPGGERGRGSINAISRLGPLEAPRPCR